MNIRVLVTLALVAVTANAQRPTCTTAHRCVTLFASTGYIMPMPGRLAVVQDSVVIGFGPGALRRLWNTGEISLIPWSGPCAYLTSGFATDGRDVVYGTSDGVCRVPVGGGSAELLAKEKYGAVAAITMTPTRVYYGVMLQGGGPFRAAVRSVSRQPGTPATTIELSNDVPTNIVTNGSYVLWPARNGMHRFSVANGTGVDVIGGPLPYVASMRADASYVYAATASAIMRMSIAMGVWQTLVSHGADDIAIDSAHLYWSSESRDEVGEVALRGGAPAILARRFAPIAVAVGTTSVFFIDGHDGDAKAISPK